MTDRFPTLMPANAALDQESLHMRSNAIAAASNGFVISDARLPDCPIVYANPAFLALTGYTEPEVLGRNCRFLQGPGTDSAAVGELRDATRNECGCQTLILNYRKDGSEFWNEVTVSPVRDAAGIVTHFVGVQTDITARQHSDAARKTAEIQLQETVALLDTLYEREHRIAESLQRSLLNKPPESILTGLEVETIYHPAWEEALVGGDYFDVFALDGGRLALVVGDVSGKGLEAASRTAEIKYTLRAYLREHSDPASALSRLNAFLCEALAMESNDQEYFVVLTLAVIETATGLTRLAAAGAEPPILLHADGSFEEVNTTGIPLGIAAKANYLGVELSLNPSDLLLIATDGITEARQGRQFLGNDGMARLAARSLPLGSLAQIGQAIWEGAKAFADGRLHDDVCLLLARRR